MGSESMCAGTLAIVGNNNGHLCTVYIKNGLNRWCKFPVRRREQVMMRADDRELAFSGYCNQSAWAD